VFYFHCRYSLWLALIVVNIIVNVTTKVNCQALVRALLRSSVYSISKQNHVFLWMHVQYTTSLFVINPSVGSASTLLMLRTMAVWDRTPLVKASLVAASLGQWGVLFHGIAIVRSTWSDVIKACVVDVVPSQYIQLNYLYSESSSRFFFFHAA
jgi:hypothetical protein